MVEYRVVKRALLLLSAILGCFVGFVGLMVSAGAWLQRTDEAPIFTLSESPSEITLPCPVEGTELIVKQLVAYEGPFLENGSDEPVTDITALVLYNAGQREIAQAEVILEGEEELSFFASHIMPGAQVLVLEKAGQPWAKRTFTACSGWAKETQQYSDVPVQIREIDMGSLTVTNTSSQPLKEIWLFYKNYLPEADLYIGGITYIHTIAYLEPGESLQIHPCHYAAGYSRILKAEEIS